MTVALPEKACPRVAEPCGSTGARVAVRTGTHVACASRGARAVFVAVRKILADAAVNGSEAGIPGPIQGVMALGVCAVGREAGRARVAANVTGS